MPQMSLPRTTERPMNKRRDKLITPKAISQSHRCKPVVRGLSPGDFPVLKEVIKIIHRLIKEGDIQQIPGEYPVLTI